MCMRVWNENKDNKGERTEKNKRVFSHSDLKACVCSGRGKHAAPDVWNQASSSVCLQGLNHRTAVNLFSPVNLSFFILQPCKFEVLLLLSIWINYCLLYFWMRPVIKLDSLHSSAFCELFPFSLRVALLIYYLKTGIQSLFSKCCIKESPGKFLRC